MTEIILPHREIPLTQGKIALVDEADFGILMKHKWHAMSVGLSWYAVRKTREKATVLMHRQLMNPPPRMVVDHRDGNGLNNTRANIRIATRQENSRNRQVLPSGKTSRYRGVVRTEGRWVARIRINKRERPDIYVPVLHLGSFGSEEEAAAAYAAAAKLYYGEFHGKLMV